MRKIRNSGREKLEFISDAASNGLRYIDRVPLGSDLAHLHWTSGYLEQLDFFRSMRNQTPVVWTMHDMNPFTGGCHYTLGCKHFELECGGCPQLRLGHSEGFTRRVLREKRKSLRYIHKNKIRFVATSSWMLEQAQKSSLLSEFDISLIPYGLDAEVFSPQPQKICRAKLGIPEHANVVLFVADAVNNFRKGFDLLIAALSGLSVAREVHLIAIGGEGSGIQTDVPIQYTGKVFDEARMADLYNSADVFVTPARAEAFGQVVFEAMACGIPVVGFATGGIRDLVRHNSTGLLVDPENVHDLKLAIETILGDSEKRKLMGAEARRITEKEYTLKMQANRYISLYDELLENV